MVLLAKTKLNSTKVLISKVSTNSYIRQDEFVSVNSALREYDDMKEGIKILKTSTIHQRFQSNDKTMLSYCLKCKKKTESKNPRFVKTRKLKPMLLSKRAMYDSKKLRFIKQQEASRIIVSSVKPLSEIPLIGLILF